MDTYLNKDRDESEKRAAKTMGVVNGTRDRSEVESMIQRYLELAHSALKDEPESSHEKPSA